VHEIDRFSKLVKQIQTQIEPRTNKKTMIVVGGRQNKQQQNVLNIDHQHHPQTSSAMNFESSSTEHLTDEVVPVVVYHTPNNSPILTNRQCTPSLASNLYGHPYSEQSPATPKPSSTFKGRLKSLFHHTPSSVGSIRTNRIQSKTVVAFGSSASSSKILQPLRNTQATALPSPPKVQTPKNKYNLRNRFFSHPNYNDDSAGITLLIAVTKSDNKTDVIAP
ncbi:unnamed protein product, partial [Didymodactylos carnosus]